MTAFSVSLREIAFGMRPACGPYRWYQGRVNSTSGYKNGAECSEARSAFLTSI